MLPAAAGNLMIGALASRCYTRQICLITQQESQIRPTRVRSMNKKTKLYFGPPLQILTQNDNNTMEITGRVNRTAERYLEIMKHHGLQLSEEERACLTKVCDFGHMAPYEIRELPIDVRASTFEAQGLDKESLAKKLESAAFADLVAVVEDLGF